MRMAKSIFANTPPMGHPVTSHVGVWHAKQLAGQSAGKEGVEKGAK